MDDLVVTGILGLIGMYLAIFLFLFTLYSAGRLVYASLAAGDFRLVLGVMVAILAIASLYMAAGCWLRKTDRI